MIFIMQVSTGNHGTLETLWRALDAAKQDFLESTGWSYGYQ